MFFTEHEIRFGGTEKKSAINDHSVLVTVEIMDKDTISRDDFLGQVVLPLSDLLASGIRKHTVTNKDGSPVFEGSVPVLVRYVFAVCDIFCDMI